MNKVAAGLFTGSLVCAWGLFFWGFQRLSSVPDLPPPPVTMSAEARQALADKEAAQHNDKARVSVQDDTVHIEMHNVIPPSYRPLEALATALGRSPQASRFTLRWHGYEGRHGAVTRVLYDRRKHVLFCSCFVSEVPWGGYYDRSVFRTVTDGKIRQDARDHKHASAEAPPHFAEQEEARMTYLDIAFADLPDYGCLRQRLEGGFAND